MKTHSLTTALLLTLSMLTVPAMAQYYNSSRGHLLDANLRVGGTSRNRRNSTSFNYRPDNNLYITGNVTGGARFQGAVPYRSQNEFQGNLGLRPLDNFRRDSTGLNSLSNNNNLFAGPRPYVDRSRTLTRPNGNAIINTDTVNLTRPASSKRFQTYNPFSINRQLQFNAVDTQLKTNFFSFDQSAEPDTEFNPIRANYQSLDFYGALSNRDTPLTVSLDQTLNRLDTTVPLKAQTPLTVMYGDQFTNEKIPMPDKSTLPTVLLPDEMKVSLPGRLTSNSIEKPIVKINQIPKVELAYRSTHLDQNLTNSSNTGQLTAPQSQLPRMTLQTNFRRNAALQAENYLNQAAALFKSGDYNHAVTKMKLAVIYHAQDPDILLAYCHTLLAQGDLLTAGFELDHSLRLANAKTLKKLINQSRFKPTDKKFIAEHINQLNSLLNTRFNPVYGLTKAYLLYLNNQPDQAAALLNQPEMQSSKLAGIKVLVKALQP